MINFSISTESFNKWYPPYAVTISWRRSSVSQPNGISWSYVVSIERIPYTETYCSWPLPPSAGQTLTWPSFIVSTRPSLISSPKPNAINTIAVRICHHRRPWCAVVPTLNHYNCLDNVRWLAAAPVHRRRATFSSPISFRCVDSVFSFTIIKYLWEWERNINSTAVESESDST